MYYILRLEEIDNKFFMILFFAKPNQKISWEDSVIMMGKPAMPHRIFVGLTHSLSWAHGWHMSRLLRETSHNAAHNI